MYDGSTALILAARLAVEGMVEELITCHADVNAVDELGESTGENSRVPTRPHLLDGLLLTPGVSASFRQVRPALGRRR